MRSTNCVAIGGDLLDGVAERTDTFNLDAHAIAAAQEFGRVEADADSGWRAGGDDVAWIERDAGRDGRDQGWDVEDQVIGRRVLAQLVVHPAAHAGVRTAELFGAGRPRPHRREVVEDL